MKKCIKVLNYQPHSLSDTDIEHPEIQLEMFFLTYPLHTIRQNLWRFFRAWLVLAGEYADEKEITSKLQFYELIEEFIELSYIKNRKKT